MDTDQNNKTEQVSSRQGEDKELLTTEGDLQQTPPVQESLSVVTAATNSIQTPLIASHKRLFFVIGLVVAILILGVTCFLGWGFYLQAKDKGSLSQDTGDVSKVSNHETMDSILFNGASYTKGFTFPPKAGTDYSSESYEWVTGGETVENWTTLITTHKLTPLSVDKPGYASAYAQNVAALNTERGATMIETSVINNPEAIASGIDANNPPYILVYTFPASGAGRPVEVNIQKVINGTNGSVKIFIFAKRLHSTMMDYEKVYFKSEEYAKDRLGVIQSALPY